MAVKNEAKIRFSAETKEFDKGIKDANSTLSTLRNELKLNEAQMRNSGVSVDGLREKQQNLAAQMEAAQDKTKALSDKLAVAVEVFGENSVEAEKLRNQLINAQTAEVKLQGAIDRCNAELERQEKAAKQAESASGKLTSEIEDQQGELKKLKDAYVDAVLEFGEGSDEAKELAAPWLSKAPVKRKSEKRIKCHGWRVRLSPEAHELLNARMRRLGYSTKQAYLENLLRVELREERKHREVSHG